VNGERDGPQGKGKARNASTSARANPKTAITKTLNPTAPSLTRCRRCGRPLSAARSLLLGAGPVCRRRNFEGELLNALSSFADDLAVAS
jgi:ribosomal protein S14